MDGATERILRSKLRDLVVAQDNVTHLNEKCKEHALETTRAIFERDYIIDNIVSYVKAIIETEKERAK